MFAVRRKFMECSIASPALSLLMKHLVTGQRQKAPHFSAFYWSHHRVVWFPLVSIILESVTGSTKQINSSCKSDFIRRSPYSSLSNLISFLYHTVQEFESNSAHQAHLAIHIPFQ